MSSAVTDNIKPPKDYYNYILTYYSQKGYKKYIIYSSPPAGFVGGWCQARLKCPI
jgi:hypothetical protein